MERTYSFDMPHTSIIQLHELLSVSLVQNFKISQNSRNYEVFNSSEMSDMISEQCMGPIGCSTYQPIDYHIIQVYRARNRVNIGVWKATQAHYVKRRPVP